MLKNYLKIGWRNITRNPLFSLINVMGLAIGISAALVIGLMVYYEFTFDKFHNDPEKIFRVTSTFSGPEGHFYNPGIPVPFYKETQSKFPGIESITPIYLPYIETVVANKSKTTHKNANFTVYTSSDYFQIFNYNWLAGDAQQALQNPNSVVLAESRAYRYFPNTKLSDIIGEELTYNDSLHFTVSGIVADFDQRSDLVFKEFFSTAGLKDHRLIDLFGGIEWDHTNSNSQLFIKLKNLNFKSDLITFLNKTFEEHKSSEELDLLNTQSFELQPLSDIHFNKDYELFDYSRTQPSKSVLFGLMSIALFLILLASINFINLHTAQAHQRAKEIGVRKVLGSSQSQVMAQVLSESFIMTSLAALVALGLSFFILHLFKEFLPQDLSLNLLFNPLVILCTLAFFIVLTIGSGIYPAFFLSRFKPISILNKNRTYSKNKINLRQSLLIFQFIISQSFIIITLMVSKQIHYVSHADMGFKKEAIAYFRTPWRDYSHLKRQRLAEELRSIPSITEVAIGAEPPASRTTNSSILTYKGEEQVINSEVQNLFAGNDYFDLYELDLIAGRLPLNDTIEEYVINEKLLQTFGFQRPEEAVGKYITTYENVQIPIVGVMRNFNQRDLSQPINPMALQGDWEQGSRWSAFRTIHFGFQTNSETPLDATIAMVESQWKAIYPDEELNIKFVDETIANFYESEKRLKKLLLWATGLMIFISALGLLALVLFTTQKRTKEIGIRKVLGAQVQELQLLLTKSFLKPILIAFFISIPIAWIFIKRWLEHYAYKTDISWWIFGVSGLFLLSISILIMFLRVRKVAKLNPVMSLRDE